MKSGKKYPYPFYSNKKIEHFLKYESKDEKYLRVNIDLNMPLDIFTHIENHDRLTLCADFSNSGTFFRKVFKFPVKNGKSSETIELELLMSGSLIRYKLYVIISEGEDVIFQDKNDYYCFEEGNYICDIASELINLTGNNDLIRIYPINSELINIDLSNDFISVHLPKETYDNYVGWRSNPDTYPWAMAAIGNTALSLAFSDAIRNHDSKDFEFKWFQFLEEKLKEYDSTIDLNSVTNSEVLGYADKILGDCLHRMIETSFLNSDLDKYSN
jgi:hypothetical protein